MGAMFLVSLSKIKTRIKLHYCMSLWVDHHRHKETQHTVCSHVLRIYQVNNWMEIYSQTINVRSVAVSVIMLPCSYTVLLLPRPP